MSEIKKCRVCSGEKLIPVIDLGKQPWANNFLSKEDVGTEELYPLCVVFCENCKAAQLNYTVSKETMFSDHTYLSGMTQTLSDHFKSLALYCDSNFRPNVGQKNVLDIGSNDGNLLSNFKQFRILGVTPENIGKLAIKKGIPTILDYFEEKIVLKILKKFTVEIQY